MANVQDAISTLDGFDMVGRQHDTRRIPEAFSKRQAGQVLAIEDSKVYKSFKPLRVVMAIFGLYHERKSGTQIHDVSAKRGEPGKQKVSALQVYSFIAVSYMWVHFIARGLVAFDGNESVANSELYYKIMLAVWYLICALQATFCYCACHYNDRLPAIWRECARLETDLPSVMEAIKLDLKTKIAAAFVVFYNAINIVYMVYLMANELTPVFLYPPFHYVVNVTVPSTEVTILNVVVAFSAFYTSLAAFVPYVIYILFCILFYTLFKAFNDEFKEEVQQALVSGEPLRVEFHRRRHLKLCKLFDIADGMFSFFLAYVLVLNTGLCCLICYMLIYHLDEVAGTPLDILVMASWAVQVVMQLGVVSIGAIVNDQAHSPLLELNEAQLDIIPDNQLISFQMFLNKLSVTPIGFSALGMFTIDKPTILTIIGMFLTYFFLMIQFKPSDVTVPCAGNFTAT